MTFSPKRYSEPNKAAENTCRPFGIYIHWPYCKSKCPYCDFFSQVKPHINQESIIDEYIKELDFYHDYTAREEVTSIFFGGGTPSLIKPQLIEKIINHIARHWCISPKVEISLEANPNTDDGTLFLNLKSAGINRLSLGVQSLNDKDLKFLGRTHTLSQALKSIDHVLKTFDNHSMDLIYARPNQSLKSWQEELQQAVSFGFKHLSLYQLTIEEGTFFAKKGIKELEEEIAANMYRQTVSYLREHNYPRYEVSNFASSQYESRHNKLYWQGDNYIGIGPSAHGRIQTQAGKIYATTHPCQMENLSPQDRAEELLFMGLRLQTGIDKTLYLNRCGIPLDSFINQPALARLSKMHLIDNTQTHLKLTDKGFLVMNTIVEQLICPE